MPSDSSRSPSRSLAHRYSDLLRFLVVGVSNLVLSYSLFFVFFRLLGGAAETAGLAQLLSYSGGVAWSFYWNRRWTFGSSGKLGPEAVRFLILQVIMAASSSALLALLSRHLLVSVHIVWILVTSLTTVLNYLSSKFIVFRGAKAGDERRETGQP